MAKILILITAHLCTAPRPQKEAEALTNVGHEVKFRHLKVLEEAQNYE